MLLPGKFQYQRRVVWFLLGVSMHRYQLSASICCSMHKTHFHRQKGLLLPFKVRSARLLEIVPCERFILLMHVST